MRGEGASVLPSVGIVVINWNGLEQSRRCLESLRALEYENVRVCLVDNGSRDGSADLLRDEFPDVEVLALLSNVGYAGGCNAGLAWAQSAGVRYVWLLNNDTTAESTALSELVSWADDLRRPTILAPKILMAKDPRCVWSAGGRLRWPWLDREHIGLGESEERHRTPRFLSWASGCSLFFPLTVVDAIGPLDERYFLYLEDVDWCLRAGRRGVPIWLVPTARLWHYVSQSTAALDSRILRYYVARNYHLLASRHCGPVGRAWAWARLLVTLAKTGMRVLLFPSYRRDSYYHAQTRGLWDFIRGRFGRAPYSDEIAGSASPALEGESVT